MAIKDSETLKSYWNLRKVATPSSYVDLIDTIFERSVVGNITKEHVNITDTAVQLKDGDTVYTELAGGSLTLGLITEDHILVAASGIKLKDDDVIKIDLQADGDVFIGEDVSAAPTTFMSIFSNSQIYNEELIGAGDVLLGDNSGSKANILWDKSSGKLLFRGGTTPQIEIDTTGALSAGGGSVTLDSEGLKFDASSGVFGTGSINWWSGLAREMSIGMITNLGNPVAGYWNSLKSIEVSISTINEDFLVYFESGSTTSNFRVSNGDAMISGYMRLGYGLYVGDHSQNTQAGDGNIEYTGVLKSYKNSTLYTGYIFVPLATPLTSTSWDGDAYSTTTKTLIDLSSVFGVPAGVKSVLAKVIVRDTASATNECWIILGPSNTAGQGLTQRCGGNANNFWTAGTHVVPCDVNGDIYYQIQASGSTSFSVYLEIWGYWM